MIRWNWRTALWVLLYVVVVVAPLVGGVLNLAHGRGFWLNFSIALGFVSLSMFGAQLVMVSRLAFVAQPLGMDGVLRFHRQMAYVATAFALVHPVILFLLDAKYWPLLNVFTSPLRAKFAVAATVALIALMLMSIFRQRLGLKYTTWKLWHWLLALVVLGASLAHAALVNYYLQDPTEQMIWLGLSALFVGVAVWMRLIHPLLRWRRRWRVVAVTPAEAGCTTLSLEPQHRGSRFRFEPGQFAWIAARRSPFSLTDNPFSISSSAEHPERIEFTIKSHQGFSAEVAQLQVGETVTLDGPHGGFVLNAPEPDAPLVFVGAGVGVTPLLSMLRTLADRQATPACHLWLANRDAKAVIAGEAIEALRPRLPKLQIVHAISNGVGDQRGQRIDANFIDRHWPADGDRASFYICGPDAFMDAVEAALRLRGVPEQHIHSERFAMA